MNYIILSKGSIFGDSCDEVLGYVESKESAIILCNDFNKDYNEEQYYFKEAGAKDTIRLARLERFVSEHIKSDF